MLTVTLNEVRDNQIYSEDDPTDDSWKDLLRCLGKKEADDEPFSLEELLERCGLNHALQCAEALPEEYRPQLRLLSCDFADTILQFIPDDKDRPRKAIEVARRFAVGEATEEELQAARLAACPATTHLGYTSKYTAAVEAYDYAVWPYFSYLPSGAAEEAAEAFSLAFVDERTVRAQQEAIFRKWLSQLQICAPDSAEGRRSRELERRLYGEEKQALSPIIAAARAVAVQMSEGNRCVSGENGGDGPQGALTVNPSETKWRAYIRVPDNDFVVTFEAFGPTAEAALAVLYRRFDQENTP